MTPYRPLLLFVALSFMPSVSFAQSPPGVQYIGNPTTGTTVLYNKNNVAVGNIQWTVGFTHGSGVQYTGTAQGMIVNTSPCSYGWTNMSVGVLAGPHAPSGFDDGLPTAKAYVPPPNGNGSTPFSFRQTIGLDQDPTWILSVGPYFQFGMASNADPLKNTTILWQQVSITAGSAISRFVLSNNCLDAFSGSSGIGPSIIAFSASPTAANPNQAVTLAWSISNATTATIDQGVGSVNPQSGSTVVYATSTTTYTLTATNGSGGTTKSATVTIGGVPPGGGASGKTISHIADGGSWQTTIVITNTTSVATNASLSFYMEAAGGSSSPWSLQMANGVNYQQIQLRPHASVWMRTPGTDSNLTVGYAILSGDSGNEAFAIFKTTVPGRHDQEGTAPAIAPDKRVLVPFDNTAGNVTSMAIVNSSGNAQTIGVTFRTASGQSMNDVVNIPAGGHVAFSTQDRFPEITGLRGVAEFNSSNGPFSAIALRFNSTGAFTTVPVFAGIPNTQLGSQVTKIIPQIADGGSWATTIVLVNTGTARGAVNLNFYQDPAGSFWPLAVNFTAPPTTVPPGTAVFVETLGAAANVTTGYATIAADPGVEAFAIFKTKVPGRQDQEGTASASVATQEILTPFDNASGNVTGVAIVNSGTDQTVLAKVLNTSGGITIAGGTHSAFVMTDQFPVSSGFQGVADFSNSNSALSIIALRFNSTGAFTSLPAFAAVPAPVKTPAQIVSPAPHATFVAPLVTFSWSAGTSVSTYAVTIGRTLNGSDIHYEPVLPPSTTSLKWNMPIDGSYIYVTVTTFFTDGTSSSSSAQYVTQTIDYAIVGTYGSSGGAVTSIAWCRALGPNSVAPKSTGLSNPTLTIMRGAEETYQMSMANVAGALLPTYTYALPLTHKTTDQIVFGPPNGSITTGQPYAFSAKPFMFPGITITRHYSAAGDSGYIEVTGYSGGTGCLIGSPNCITFEGYIAADATHCETVFDDSIALDFIKPIQ